MLMSSMLLIGKWNPKMWHEECMLVEVIFFMEGHIMKKITVSKSILALACLASLSLSAQAQTAPAAPESTLAFNAGVVSEYRYRGISQSRFQPAMQGGVDYTDKSGFYVGTWASTIKWIKDAGGSAPVELDLYGGYKFSLGEVAMDVGYLRYQYVNNTLSKTGGGGVWKNANTDEIYVAGTMGPFTLKYSYALSDLFGQYDFTNQRSSKGSDYIDLNATFDLGNGFTLVPQVGRQTVKNIANASYTHTSLSLNKDMGNGLVLTATLHETDAKSSGGYTVGDSGGSQAGKNTGKSTVFNALTGLRQHTGNWPGKTVARAEGGFSYRDRRYRLVDLPGTYSLLSTSVDEEIARDFLLFGRPDVTVVVADATRLERNLNLVLQVLEITDRVVVAVNLMDEARRKGITVRATADCLIAALALQHDAVLLHDDDDYRRIAELRPLRAWSGEGPPPGHALG